MSFHCASSVLLLLLLLLLSGAVRNISDLRGTFVVHEWPFGKPIRCLGPLSGVAIDAKGSSFLLSRLGRNWETGDFDEFNWYTRANQGPIAQHPIAEFDNDGLLVNRMGAGVFFLPHGLSVDSRGQLWTTDLARHQAIRFNGYTGQPDMLVGEAFQPGGGDGHFCQPTQAIAAESGEFFVADGYCNHRVVKFNSDGVKIGEFGRKPSFADRRPQADEFLVPHGLALLESRDLLCVADREHKRVQCFRAGLKSREDFGLFVVSVGSGVGLGRVHGVAFVNWPGRLLVLHAGEGDSELEVAVFETVTWRLLERIQLNAGEWGEPLGHAITSITNNTSITNSTPSILVATLNSPPA